METAHAFSCWGGKSQIAGLREACLRAKDLLRPVELFCDRLPAIAFDPTAEETADLAQATVVNLPERSGKQPAGRE